MAQIQRPRSASQVGRTPQRRHDVSSDFKPAQRPPVVKQSSCAAVCRTATAERASHQHVFLGKNLNGRGDMHSLLL